MKEYLPRLSDPLLQKKLRTSGAVLITGCKWCGKTMSASQHANSIIYMQDADKKRMYQNMADTKPSLLLKGDVPHLIDEWQVAPVLWDAVRHEVDIRRRPGQFLLTGSAVPAHIVDSHTGTGRISRVMMRPMSLYESGESSGEISLKALFDQTQEDDAMAEFSIEDISHAICRGGWPASLSFNKDDSLEVAKNYVESLIEEDISRVDGVERNPQRAFNLLRSLSRNICTLASNVTVMEDMASNESSMTPPTFDSYINAFRRIFVVEDVPAWSPAMRSKSALRAASKRVFVDPSIAAAVLRTNPERLLTDFNTFGFLFEALCIRDMRVYAQANDGDIFHYRDRNELEADMIVQLRDGRWGAVEVKLGTRQIEEASANLLKLAEKVNTDKMGAPSFLMVLTGGEYAYRRKDGVWVVPISTLRN